MEDKGLELIACILAYKQFNFQRQLRFKSCASTVRTWGP